MCVQVRLEYNGCGASHDQSLSSVTFSSMIEPVDLDFGGFMYEVLSAGGRRWLHVAAGGHRWLLDLLRQRRKKQSGSGG